ncbi:nuclear transport factor 2 family protein [Pseudochelatococcus sp. B33]
MQEHPWRFEGLTAALVGRDEIVDDYRRMFAGREDMVFTIKEIHRTADPDCIIVEFNGRSRVTETGGIYDQNYIAVFRLRDGKIWLNKFHFNPLVTKRAFDGVLIGAGISKQDA